MDKMGIKVSVNGKDIECRLVYRKTSKENKRVFHDKHLLDEGVGDLDLDILSNLDMSPNVLLFGRVLNG